MPWRRKRSYLRAAQFQFSHGQYSSDLIYGAGDAGEQIAKLLSSIKPKINKKITY